MVKYVKEKMKVSKEHIFKECNELDKCKGVWQLEEIWETSDQYVSYVGLYVYLIDINSFYQVNTPCRDGSVCVPYSGTTDVCKSMDSINGNLQSYIAVTLYIVVSIQNYSCISQRSLFRG